MANALRVVAAGLLFLLAAGAAGCQTETRAVGRDPYSSLSGGWRELGGEGEGAGEEPGGIEAPPRLGPDEAVDVPVEAFRPVGRFLDGEGYLLGDRIVIECSFEPFMARFAAYASSTGDGKYVLREDSRDAAAGVHQVHLTSAIGPTHMEAYVPRVSFAGPRDHPEAIPNPRPPFMFYGTGELIVRFHLVPDPDRPVFFTARAAGTPPAQDPEGAPRPCMYKYLRSGGRSTVTEGDALVLGLEVRRDQGVWRPLVREPRAEEPGTPR